MVNIHEKQEHTFMWWVKKKCPFHWPSAQLLLTRLSRSSSTLPFPLLCPPVPCLPSTHSFFPACTLKIATEGPGLLRREDRNKNSGLESDSKHTDWSRACELPQCKEKVAWLSWWVGWARKIWVLLLIGRRLRACVNFFFFKDSVFLLFD